MADPRAFAQDRVQLNSISKVEVKGTTVEISGSQRPNFTTFTSVDALGPAIQGQLKTGHSG